MISKMLLCCFVARKIVKFQKPIKNPDFDHFLFSTEITTIVDIFLGFQE
jgi:hypothetical protein